MRLASSKVRGHKRWLIAVENEPHSSMPRASIAVVLDFVQSVRPGKGGTRAATEQVGHHAANEFLRP